MPGSPAVSPTAAAHLSNRPGASGSSTAASAAAFSDAARCAAIDEKQTSAVPARASGRIASTSSAVPLRSTSNTRRASAIVGEMPATCATLRRSPSAATRSASPRTPDASVTSSTTASHRRPSPDIASTAVRTPASSTSASTNASTVPARRCAQAAPIPRAAPVTTATEVMRTPVGPPGRWAAGRWS